MPSVWVAFKESCRLWEPCSLNSTCGGVPKTEPGCRMKEAGVPSSRVFRLKDGLSVLYCRRGRIVSKSQVC